jgi:PAS domain S-box-containing protein
MVQPTQGVAEVLRRENERLQLMAEAAGALLLTEDPRELTRGIFARLSAHLGLEIYFNFLLSESEPRLRLDSCAGVNPEVARELEWLEFGQAVCGYVALHREQMVCEDVQHGSDSRQDLIRSLGITGYACFPLSAQGQLVGTLSFGSRHRGRFQPDELDLMQTAADQVAAALARKRAHEDLRRRSAELQERAHLLDHAHAFIRDMEGAIVFWSKGAGEMYGWTREEALGKLAHQLLHTRFPVSRRAVEEQVAREGSWEGELVHTRRDGSRIVVSSHWVLHRDSRDNPAAILQVNADVTGLRRAEAALRESEWRYRTLSEAVPAIVFTCQPDGRCDYTNERWRDYTGMTLEQTRDYGWTAALHRDDLPATTRRWKESLESGRPFEAQYRFRRADGAYRWFLSRCLPMRGVDGEVVNWLGACMDIEDHKRVEEALRRAQKSESIGALAGGVAHQFNNLLTGVLGGVSFALESVPDGDPMREILGGAAVSAQRAAELTAQLLAYAGKGRFVLEPLDVSSLVRQAGGLLESAIPRKVRLKFELAGGLPPVQADASQLRQLVMSLVMNGAEAIAEKTGTVCVRTGLERLEQRLAGPSVTDELAPGAYVFLEVEDDGCGMDAATLPRIFDPFLHHQVHGPRARAGCGAGHRARARGRHPHPQRPGARQHLPGASAGRGGGAVALARSRRRPGHPDRAGGGRRGYRPPDRPRHPGAFGIRGIHRRKRPRGHRAVRENGGPGLACPARSRHARDGWRGSPAASADNPPRRAGAGGQRLRRKRNPTALRRPACRRLHQKALHLAATGGQGPRDRGVVRFSRNERRRGGTSSSSDRGAGTSSVQACPT